MTSAAYGSELRLLLDQGSPEDLRELLERTPDVVKPLLSSAERVPLALAEALLAEDGPLLALLVGNHQAIAADADLRELLAASGKLVVAATAFHDQSWTLPELRTLMAAADPGDRRWFSQPNPALDLLNVRSLAGAHRRLVLRAAVVCPVPEVVAHALGELLPDEELTRAERLRGMLSLITDGGPAALTKLLYIQPLRARLGEDAALGLAAVAGPSGVAKLRAAVEAAEAAGPATLVAELYGSAKSLRIALLLHKRLDWAAVLAAHTSRPLALEVAAVLAALPDCPDEVLAALCAEYPGAEELLDGLDRPVPLAAFGVLKPTKETRKLLATAVRNSLDRGGSAEELLAARPAVAVLEAVQGLLASGPGSREKAAGFTTQLAALVAEKLGAGVSSWRRVRQRLSRFRGTIPELLDDAAGKARADAGVGKPWPEAAARPGFTESVSPRGARAAFLALLDAATPEVQWRLLPHLDDRTAYDLLVLGSWRDEWLDQALAAPGREQRLLLARRRDLPAEAVTALAALDDPAVNAGLVYQPNLTWDQRLALVTGAPFTPGRTERLPIDDEVREALRSTSRRDKKPYLAPWVASGDQEILDCCLNGVSLASLHLQWRFALGLWERQGPEGLLDRIPGWFQSKVQTTLTGLLTDPDRDAALRKSREWAREAGGAKSLARRMRQWNNRRNLEWLLAEGFAWDWDELLTEHLRNPLPADLVRELAQLDGCPALLREEVARMTRPEQTAFQKLLDGTPAAKALAKTTLSAPGEGIPWVELAIRQGCLTWVDLLQSGKPGYRVLAALADGGGRTDQNGARDAGRELAALVREHLDGNREAWVLALRMLPDFTGTVPELLQTAVLACLAPSALVVV